MKDPLGAFFCIFDNTNCKEVIPVTPVDRNVPSLEDFLEEILDGFDIEGKGLIIEAWRIAKSQHRDQLRRCGDRAIEHPLAVALKLKRLGMDAATIAAGILHDCVEDGTITIAQILRAFGPKHGRKIALLVWAVSKRGGLPPADYFQQIVRISKIYWETPVIKVVDREHNHVCPYGGTVDREIRLCRETLDGFGDMCRQCSPDMPDYFRPNYDQELERVLGIARNRLIELEPDTH